MYNWTKEGHSTLLDLNSLCRQIRRDVLICSHASGHGHIPSCFSVIEMLCAVYHHIRHNPQNPDWPERDIFILSKGHASLGFYCTLANLGYFPADSVKTFGQYGSRFGCHADRFKVSGVEASTGSLGHGIGLAVGIALAFKVRSSERQVYTLIGDGEANEGTVWESLMVAHDLRLNNLTILFDYNRSQSRSMQITQAESKFSSFGCDVFHVDGHDLYRLDQALKQPTTNPKVILADTIKGFGCRTLIDNVFEWHRKSPNDEQLKLLLEELDAQAI